MEYLGPLEGQLTQSQVENVNLRRHLAEHLAVYDLLAVPEQDRDRAVAEHRALLDTLNIRISVVCGDPQSDPHRCYSGGIEPCFCSLEVGITYP